MWDEVLTNKFNHQWLWLCTVLIIYLYATICYEICTMKWMHLQDISKMLVWIGLGSNYRTLVEVSFFEIILQWIWEHAMAAIQLTDFRFRHVARMWCPREGGDVRVSQLAAELHWIPNRCLPHPLPQVPNGNPTLMLPARRQATRVCDSWLAFCQFPDRNPAETQHSWRLGVGHKGSTVHGWHIGSACQYIRLPTKAPTVLSI